MAVKEDYLSNALITIFVLAMRARRYQDGYALPLSVADVSDVLACYPCPLPRWLIDDVVFELDYLYLQETNQRA